MILLTGATGFIGSRILDALIAKYGYDNVVALTSKPIVRAQYVLHKDYCFDEKLLEDNGFINVDTIVHAGAFTPKSGAEANSVCDSNSNIINSYRLLTLKFPKLSKLIFLSTLDVYANTQDVISEETIVKPGSLYGSSKFYCESMIETWCSQNNVQNTILRIGHVFGPGEYEYKKLIPEVMRNVLNNSEIKIWGDGNDIRNFIYIDDVVDAILASINVFDTKGPINVVSDSDISILDVIKTVIRISGYSKQPIHIPSDHIPRNLRFDNSKMRNMLVAPKVSFDEGIKSEWEAFKEYYAKNNL
jgi:nucleoside-diphosphate-sugar epimerase